MRDKTSVPALLGTVVVLAGSLLGAPMGALLALFWAYLTRTPWADLGLARPRAAGLLLLGIPLGVALKLLMKAVVMRLLGAPDRNPAFQFLTGNAAALPSMILVILLSAGLSEEILFRGFLFERLRAFMGGSRAANVAILVLTSTLFGLAHLREQGVPGAEQAAIMGLVFGGLYLATGRLWLTMIVHAAFDLTAVALIYGGLETRVAHWFFR